MLDAKYEETNLDKLIKESINLDNGQQWALQNLLLKYKDLFDGT